MIGKVKIITIFGTSKAAPGQPIYETARQLGWALAEQGYTIANGGYGGTMQAAAEGAAGCGGHVIGVTCTAFGRKGPNACVTQEIQTTSLSERLSRLVDFGQAYIVLEGGTGTLLELAHVWELKNKRLAEPSRPILLMGGFWAPLVEMMAQADPGCRECIQIVGDVREAVDQINQQFKMD